MKTFFLTLIVSLTLISCSTGLKTIPLKSRDFNSVEINQLLNKEIGDVLITKGKELYQDAVEITERPQKLRISYSYPYQVGDVLVLSGSNDVWDLYYNKNDLSKMEKDMSFGVAVNKIDNSIVKPFSMSPMLGIYYKDVDEPFKVKMTKINKECVDCFKQEFIFNGKVSNSLKFIYREYISDMARPAFTQELQYDINESNTIGFKGLRIEIVKATNSNIEYKVLSTFQSR